MFSEHKKACLKALNFKNFSNFARFIHLFIKYVGTYVLFDISACKAYSKFVYIIECTALYSVQYCGVSSLVFIKIGI